MTEEKRMSQEVMDTLESMGWSFVPYGPNEWEWRLFDEEGLCIGQMCDENWARDIAIALAKNGEE